jgi:hypothetical protein
VTKVPLKNYTPDISISFEILVKISTIPGNTPPLPAKFRKNKGQLNFSRKRLQKFFAFGEIKGGS